MFSLIVPILDIVKAVVFMPESALASVDFESLVVATLATSGDVESA